MARYGPAAQKAVERAMRKRKRGTLRSRTGRKVTSREQAVAIGLSEARGRGAKLPPRRCASRRTPASARYGEAARESVDRALRTRRRGTLTMGRSGRRVKSEEQAIALAQTFGILDATANPVKETRKVASNTVTRGMAWELLGADPELKPQDANLGEPASLAPPKHVGPPRPEHAATNRAFQGIPSMAVAPRA